jgi:pyruvate,orthophosphate dikinase
LKWSAPATYAPGAQLAVIKGDPTKEVYGEFLINAQGEDVVAGIRTPQEITELARKEAGSDKPSMEKAMPAAFNELTRIYGVLERHYRDMQDLEFTVEQGKLWMLQTRLGKRTAKAALRIAVEFANEGLITRKEAVTRIDPGALDQLLHPTIDPNAERKIIATGLPASPGAASGEIVFSSEARPTAPKRSIGAQPSSPTSNTPGATR